MKKVLMPLEVIYKVENIINEHIKLLNSGNVMIKHDFQDNFYSSLEKLEDAKELLNPTTKVLKRQLRKLFSSYVDAKNKKNEAYHNKDWENYKIYKKKTDKMLREYIEMKKLVMNYEELEVHSN